MDNTTTAVSTRQTFDKKQIEIMRRTIAKDISTEDFLFFLEVCKYRGLNPFNREVYAIVRQGKMTIQMGIDGFRKQAESSGKYRGQKGPYFCGEDGQWKEEWLLSTPPVAAKVGILRSDFDEPIWAIARYESYVQRDKDGKPTTMWAKFHDVLLAKCAEALAIRKTFPAQCGGMYASEEMLQADIPSGMVIESVSPISKRLNEIDQQGQAKGCWKNQSGMFAFMTAELGVNISRDVVYDLTDEQLDQIARAIEEEKAIA